MSEIKNEKNSNMIIDLFPGERLTIISQCDHQDRESISENILDTKAISCRIILDDKDYLYSLVDRGVYQSLSSIIRMACFDYATYIIEESNNSIRDFMLDFDSITFLNKISKYKTKKLVDMTLKMPVSFLEIIDFFISELVLTTQISNRTDFIRLAINKFITNEHTLKNLQNYI